MWRCCDAAGPWTVRRTRLPDAVNFGGAAQHRVTLRLAGGWIGRACYLRILNAGASERADAPLLAGVGLHSVAGRRALGSRAEQHGAQRPPSPPTGGLGGWPISLGAARRHGLSSPGPGCQRTRLTAPSIRRGAARHGGGAGVLVAARGVSRAQAKEGGRGGVRRKNRNRGKGGGKEGKAEKKMESQLKTPNLTETPLTEHDTRSQIDLIEDAESWRRGGGGVGLTGLTVACPGNMNEFSEKGTCQRFAATIRIQTWIKVDLVCSSEKDPGTGGRGGGRKATIDEGAINEDRTVEREGRRGGARGITIRHRATVSTSACWRLLITAAGSSSSAVAARRRWDGGGEVGGTGTR